MHVNKVIDKSKIKMLVVISEFYQNIAKRLLEGVQSEYVRWGGNLEKLREIWVPGALEIPFALGNCLDTGTYQAAVVLGCVIRGETDHYQHVCEQSIGHSMRLSLQAKIPLGMGILTVNTLEQALARSGGNCGNKGQESCAVALQMMERVCP